MGEEYYPMPWSKLDYDTELGGYRVDVTEDQLRGAPKFSRSTNWDWSNRTNDERVYKYYNEPLGKEAVPHWSKSRPPRDPPFLTGQRCRSRAWDDATIVQPDEVGELRRVLVEAFGSGWP
jgi:hypothetical protein